MGVIVHDPLTCNDWWVHKYSICSCTAPAFKGMAEHSWVCNVSPTFAELSLKHQYSDITNEFIRASLSTMQTVIKCAICGKQRLAKDMKPIYKNGTGVGSLVKAVCPSHNRDSKPRWVHARG